MFEAKKIAEMIEAHIPGSKVDVKDLTGGADHFSVDVVSAAFAGKSIIDQHRMVYAALGDAVGGDIHALKVNTRIPNS